MAKNFGRSRVIPLVFVLTGFAAGTKQAWSQVSVLTWHNDNMRTGQNLSETTLTPSNVNSTNFGKKCSYSVDGQVYAQPLYVPNLSIAGGTHNVIYAATEHDSVYALDADCLSSSALWHRSFLGTGITTMPCTAKGQPQCDTTILAPERGITATPVIDPASNTIYVGAQTVENGVYTQKLHALDLTTGAEKFMGPVIMNPSCPNNSSMRLNQTEALQRSSLLLLNGVVYVPIASNDSTNGWLIGYNVSTLAQQGVFCVTPHGSLGAIWMSGAGPASDSLGNIYFTTGNGTFDANTGGADYSMTLVKLAVSGSTLSVGDYWTPGNEAHLSNRDLDLSSGGVMILPDQPGTAPHEAVLGFKTGEIILLNRDNLGKFNAAPLQDFIWNKNGFWSSPTYWNGNVYFWEQSAVLTQWTLSNGRFPSSPTHSGSISYTYPGATVSISANGTTNGILWSVQPNGQVQGGSAAILHAFDATNVSSELYNSNQAAGGRDVPGAANKFAVPTVANGKVIIGTQTDVDVYGLLH